MEKERGAWSVRRGARARGAAEPGRQRVPRRSPGTRQALPDQFLILIYCASEAEQVRLLSRFQAEGVRCRALIS
jgi:hypothetical protein